MRKFLLHILLPTVAILLLLTAAAEGLLRLSPNERLYKSRYMKHHAAELQTLVLGSSNTNRAIIPSRLGQGRAFSSAGSAQDLCNDEWILEKYIRVMDSLRYVILDLNYASLLSDIGHGDEYATLRPQYRVYWGNPRYEVSWTDYLEVSRFNWLVKRKEIVDRDTIHPDGFMSRPRPPYDDNDWQYYGWQTALDHTRIDNPDAASLYRDNMARLRHIADLCRQHGTTVVLVSCPVHEYFRKHLDERQVSLMRRAADSLCSEYANVKRIDFLDSTLFSAEEMNNANHLNLLGATRFSDMIADSLSQWEAMKERP